MASTRFLLIGLLLAACSAPEAPPAGPSPTVATKAAPPEPTPEAPEYVGVVTARNSEIIPAAFTGRVTHLDVSNGKPVHPGDNIAKLDDTDLKSKIEGLKWQEKSSQAQAGASGAMASMYSKDARNTAKLVKMGYLPGNALSTTNAQMASNSAQAGVGVAQANATRFDRSVLERQLANAQITAPKNGVVLNVKAHEGEVVQQGAQIARIYDPSDLIIKFVVPKADKNRIRAGRRIELHIEGTTRTLWARIETFQAEEAPLDFLVVTADLDDSKLQPDEVAIASIAHVKLVEDKPAKVAKK
jgi:multidrug efflux pump subunit AcrA (membrane-fusion protein)